MGTGPCQPEARGLTAPGPRHPGLRGARDPGKGQGWLSCSRETEGGRSLRRKNCGAEGQVHRVCALELSRWRQPGGRAGTCLTQPGPGSTGRQGPEASVDTGGGPVRECPGNGANRVLGPGALGRQGPAESCEKPGSLHHALQTRGSWNPTGSPVPPAQPQGVVSQATGHRDRPAAAVQVCVTPQASPAQNRPHRFSINLKQKTSPPPLPDSKAPRQPGEGVLGGGDFAGSSPLPRSPLAPGGVYNQPSVSC